MDFIEFGEISKNNRIKLSGIVCEPFYYYNYLKTPKKGKNY